MKRPFRRLLLPPALLAGLGIFVVGRSVVRYITRPPVRYTVRVVGDEGRMSNAFAMNNNGEVLGLIGLGGDSIYYFLERDGQLTRLTLDKPLPSPPSSDAPARHVREHQAIREQERHRFRPLNVASDGTRVGEFRNRPIAWRNGIAEELPLPPGYSGGRAEAIGDRGQVVGSVNTRGSCEWQDMGTRSSNGTTIKHACLWENGTVRVVGANIAYSTAEAVNGRGQIVGSSSDGYWSLLRRRMNMGRTGRATLFEDGKAIDLNLLIPRRSGWLLRDAIAINDRGEILGTGTYHLQHRAYLLTPVARRNPGAGR